MASIAPAARCARHADGTCGDGLTKGFAWTLKPAPGEAPQAERAKRTPVIGVAIAGRIRTAARPLATGPCGRSPAVEPSRPPAGAHIDAPGQFGHGREEVGVAGEVEASGPDNQEAQGLLADVKSDRRRPCSA